MDIWNWIDNLSDDLIEAGHEDAADNIYELSDHVCEFEYERAAALLPEIKALGKSLANPWLEVFAGHWEMRNRLGWNFEGESALPDVIRLFEFAHRENTMECPQSVCVTQDVSTCYGNIDGPGWFEERVAVCDETLARINPHWACFQCLSAEKATAINDSGRPEEALIYFNKQLKTIRTAGVECDDEARLIQIHLNIAAGQYDKALRLITVDENENPNQSKQTTEARTLCKAEALAKLGRDQAAWEILPSLTNIAYINRPAWIRTAHLLLQRAPERNNWQLGRNLQETLSHFSAVGSHRPLIDAALLCAHLALQRNALWSARYIFDLAKLHQPKLRTDFGVAAALDKLEAEIAQKETTAIPLPVPADQLFVWLEQRSPEIKRNPEEEIEWLLAAHRQLPNDVDLLQITIYACHACAATDHAFELMWRFVKNHKNEETPILYRLLGELLSHGKTDQVEQLITLIRDTLPVVALWGQANLARHNDDWPAVIKYCEKMLEQSPQSNAARKLLGKALRIQGRYQEAADCYQIVSDKAENPDHALWDHMTSASAAKDWNAVRTSAAKLKITLSSTQGPIEEEWGTVLVRYQENGKTFDYYALRTGPVTARIVENALPGETQHVGDWIVFDAIPLIDPPEDEEERKNFLYTYMLECVLEQSSFGTSWIAEGVYPGDEVYRTFCETIEKLGYRSWIHSSPDYVVTDSEDDREYPAFCFSIAAPQGVTPGEIDKLLTKHTSNWEHRVSWLQLADAAGVATDPHLDIIDRYDL